MSKSRIPALTRGLATASPSSRPPPRSLASKQSTNTSKSSNLLHYGFAMGKTNSTKAGIKKTKSESKENENKEKSEIVKEDVVEDATKPESTKENELATDTIMSDNVEDEECGSVDQEGIGLPEKHLNLSEAQLNALSYSLSELADKISPSKTDYFDDEDWEKKHDSGTERRNSLGRVKTPADLGNSPHSKSPYSRKNQSEAKPYLSKQKSFNKSKPIVTSKELNLSDDDKARSSELQTDKKETMEKEEMMFKGASPHQESIESGYNSSWSASSLSEDFKNFKSSTDDTDVDADSKDLIDETPKDVTDVDEQQSESSAADYEKALQQKISDVEKRINSLILGANSIDSEAGGTEAGSSDKKLLQSQESEGKNPLKNNAEILKDELRDEVLANGFREDSHEPTTDLNQNNSFEKSKSLARSRDVDQEISGKSPFQLHKVRKASLDESRVSPKPKRPGLVRRRTTLVTFRAPRQASAFNEVDDSGVLEIDEAGFVQCLTDVRAMKTMLLKLKRELQEAEVVSPLAKSKSISSRSISNLSNLCENDFEESGARRNTYDSSEVIHEKLRRIRSASLSRRKQSSCLERPSEEQLSAETSTEATVETKRQNSTDEEVKKMKEEMEDLREKMKVLKQERDTLVIDKEEIERELETKNHTIKLLQKQLEVQENSEEMAFLQRQVAALTYQVRQQQQKITELKYRTSTPPNTSRSTSPTNFSTKKDSVKHDIKNRLRDAFVRHLEESSKSHVLLSKHIEKAEFTINEAQKGLKSIYIAPTSQTTASKESLTEVGKSSEKARPSPNLLGTPRTPEAETRRHSWTANSIDKIIKTWKETAKSIENLSSGSTNNNKKSSQLPKPKSAKSSPHVAFL